MPAAPAATLWGRLTDQLVDTRPASGTIRLTAQTPDVPDSTTGVILHHQRPVMRALDEAGEFAVTVQDADTTWLVEFFASHRAVWTRHWIPTPGEVTNIRDLPEVDPTTLEPTETPEAAWWAALEAGTYGVAATPDPGHPGLLILRYPVWRRWPADPMSIGIPTLLGVTP